MWSVEDVIYSIFAHSTNHTWSDDMISFAAKCYFYSVIKVSPVALRHTRLVLVSLTDAELSPLCSSFPPFRVMAWRTMPALAFTTAFCEWSSRWQRSPL